MTGVAAGSLAALYSDTDDPWRHRDSDYERDKHAATVAALTLPRYRAILEIGCGNGELGRHLVKRGLHYAGVDAVERALIAARRAVPSGSFHQVFLPAPLPDGPYDLVVLSEVLYFLDRTGLATLADTLSTCWPDAELLAVNWLGPTGHELSGEEALAAFAEALPADYGNRLITRSEWYRIDRLSRTLDDRPA